MAAGAGAGAGRQSKPKVSAFFQGRKSLLWLCFAAPDWVGLGAGVAASHAPWLPVLSRLHNIAEHALMVQNGTDPLRHARNTFTSVLERAPAAPRRVNHHGEHDMFTPVPYWNLPKAYQLLAACGVTAPMGIQPGYVRVLQLATVRSAAFGTVDGVN